MIRKQVYITGAQEANLKKHSALTGRSEGELVRAALDAAFGFEPRMTPEQEVAFDEFVSAARRVRPPFPPEGERVYVRSSNYERRFFFKSRNKRHGA